MPDLASRLAALLDVRLADPDYTVGRAAHELGVTDRHLRRRLVAATGETPGALLRRLRLDRAVALAATHSAASAARASGFRDAEAFRRAYRAATGARFPRS